MFPRSGAEVVSADPLRLSVEQFHGAPARRGERPQRGGAFFTYLSNQRSIS
jgi:hypothetical protein